MKPTTNNSGSGYCKMPDGTLIQWGVLANLEPRSYTGTQRGTIYFYEIPVNVQFPIEFTILPQLMLTKAGGTMAAIGWSAWTANQITEIDLFSGEASITAMNATIHWLAIGRWK